MNDPTSGAPMSRGDRLRNEKLISLRARTARQEIDFREAEMLADIEEKLAATYAIDDSAWEEVARAAELAIAAADQALAVKCEELGILPEFRPRLDLQWWDRGENAAAARRAELRRVAQSKVRELAKRARLEVEKETVKFLEQLLAGALNSDEGRQFFESVPTVAELLPFLEVSELLPPATPSKSRFDWHPGELNTEN